MLGDDRMVVIAEDDVVVLRAAPVDEAEAGALPLDAVLGGDVVDHEAVLAVDVLDPSVGQLVEGFGGLRNSLVPHAVTKFGILEDRAAPELGVIELPILLRNDERIARVLGDGPDAPRHAAEFVDDVVIKEKLTLRAEMADVSSGEHEAGPAGLCGSP